MKSLSRFNTFALLALAIVILATACSKDNENSADQYVTWKMGSNNGSLSVPADSLTMYQWSDATSVYGMTKLGSTYFEITFPTLQSTGTYPATSFSVFVNGTYFVPAATPIQVNVVSYGAPGQYIAGTYSGTVKDSTTSSTMSVTGTFRVKIQ